MPFRPVLLCLFALVLPTFVHADISISTNRTTLYQGEKLTVVLEIDKKVEQRPSLKILEQSFNVLGTKKVTLSSHTTGTVTNSTQWHLKLRAIKAGNITLPSITLGDEISREIPLTVLPSELNPSPEDTGLKPVFIDLEVDKDELYVGSQAILRTKIYHLNPLPLDSQLSDPIVRNALIKKLEERQEYKTQINGQSYFVTEYSYTLFPKDAAAVEVEPFIFNATMDNGEILELTSSLLLLNVLPKAFSNTRDIWLPAESVYIEDNLQDSQSMSKGASLTRIITLEAEGLPASSLPLLAELQNSKAEIKLTNVVLEEQMTEKGIISRRMEELQITPTQAGEIVLPAIDLPWWNTRQEKAQNAAIPQRTISATIPASETSTSSESTTAEDSSSGNPTLLIWLLTGIAIIASLGCIYAFYFLRKNQQTGQLNTAEPTQERAMQQLATDVAERNAFRALTNACEQNNPEFARIRLIEWGQIFWRNIEINSVEEVCNLAENRTLNFLVMDMEQYLMSNPHLWQGDLLLDSIQKVRDRRRRMEANNIANENH